MDINFLAEIILNSTPKMLLTGSVFIFSLSMLVLALRFEF
jgi:hypothetical protein